MADVAAPVPDIESASRCLVIGCGNPTRADDGVGPWVARRLQERVAALPDGVRILDAGTAGMEIMFQARGAQRLIIIDACTGADAPGSVLRVPGSELECDGDHNYTLHDFRWNHALHAGRQMYGADFPTRVEVFLVEAADLDFGLELSPTVQAGAERVVDMLEQEIAGYRDGNPQQPT